MRDVRVLVVDDLDRDLDAEQRDRVLALLRDLAGDGLTVLMGCVDISTALRADAIVPVDEEAVVARAEDPAKSDAATHAGTAEEVRADAVA